LEETSELDLIKYESILSEMKTYNDVTIDQTFGLTVDREARRPEVFPFSISVTKSYTRFRRPKTDKELIDIISKTSDLV